MRSTWLAISQKNHAPRDIADPADPVGRRYQKKRHSEQRSIRSLHRHSNRSRFDAWAYKVRDGQERYIERRRAFIARQERHAERPVAMIPLRHTRIAAAAPLTCSRLSMHWTRAMCDS